jgi:photosystem II stability/assembly factor-like uncharacterized protein
MNITFAMSSEIVVAREHQGTWQLSSSLKGLQITCLAADPFHPERLYCGTYRRGLWRSDDGGESWHLIGDTPVVPTPINKPGITQANIMAVAVSPVERSGEYGVVYVGTEPSEVFRSEDGGESWQKLSGLSELPSASTWSFPPKPDTSHVCKIIPDLHVPGRVFVAIEAGALVYTPDGGQTWKDRVTDGPYDTHTLVMHPHVQGRLYSAAGDGFGSPGRGFNESFDGGQTWHHPNEGLDHQYLSSVAVDPANPETIVVSAASSPRAGLYPLQPESFIYRKTQGEPWQLATEGLPEQGNMILSVLVSSRPGEFYALNNRGLYHSVDAGLTWKRLALPWKAQFAYMHPIAIVVSEQ